MAMNARPPLPDDIKQLIRLVRAGKLFDVQRWIGDLQVEQRLAFGVVLGFDDLLRFILAGCIEAGALAGVVVHAVETPTTDATTNQTVTCFHTIFHATAKINEADSNRLADRRWLNTAYAVFLRIRKMVSVLVSVADPEPLKPLLH